jgi:hypothetical protein
MDIKIIINTPKTKKEGITITVKTNDTISSAKEKYYSEANSRVNNQWLYDGAVLKDSDVISTIGIEDLDIIEAHPSSKGGYHFYYKTI